MALRLTGPELADLQARAVARRAGAVVSEIDDQVTVPPGLGKRAYVRIVRDASTTYEIDWFDPAANRDRTFAEMQALVTATVRP